MGQQRHITIINQRITELLGLHFAVNQWDGLDRRLKQFANALKINNSPERISQWISQHDIPQKELEVLIDHLTICETYFFREKKALKLLTENIIPSIEASCQHQKKHLSIWCAGCSSGEEPYTLAITLRESLPNPDQWIITLLGTDLNTQALQKAQQGEYSPWSFRDTPETIKQKYFTKKEKKLLINPGIKKMVQFSRHNLATDTFPTPSDGSKQWDVIFCRNVLMYFSPDVIKRITKEMYDILKTDAWFITSQVELNDDYFNAFQRVMFNNGIFYRKSPKETYKLKQEQSPLAKNAKASFQPLKSKRKGSNAKASQHERAKTSPEVRIKKQEHSLISHNSNDLHASQDTARFIKARALADAGKLDEAAETMSSLLKSGRGQAEHFFVYATVLIELGKFQEADQNLVKALYLEPNHLAARLNRSQLLRKTGKHEQASKEMQNLLDDISTFDDHEPLLHLDGMTAGRVRQMAGSFSFTK